MFLIGIAWKLADGYPHELRAADYDDWVTLRASAGNIVDTIYVLYIIYGHA